MSRALLSLDPSRHALLRQISGLGSMILKNQHTDIIEPTNLARIIPVSQDMMMPDAYSHVGTDYGSMAKIIKSLDRWNKPWGFILANSDTFFGVCIFLMVGLFMLSRIWKSRWHVKPI